MKRISSLAIALGLATNLVAQTPLRHESYLDLNGEGQHLSVPGHSDFNIELGKSYTYSFWLYGYRTFIHGDAQRIFSRYEASQKAIEHDVLNRSGYEVSALKTSSNGFIGANLYNAAGTTTTGTAGWLSAPKESYLRTWYHCALVVDRKAGHIKVYVDGQVVSTIDKEVRAYSAVNNLPFLIGAGRTAGRAMGFFAGRIDNLRVYHKALSAEELKRDAETERYSGEVEGLVADFDFEGLKAGESTYTDRTGRHTASLVGYPGATGHSLIKTYDAHRTNGHLIGRGANQALSVFALGIEGEHALEYVELATPEASQTKNITRYRLVLTDNGDRYDHRLPTVTVAEGKPSVGVTRLKATSKAPQLTKRSRLWLVADVAGKATEGDLVKTQVVGIKLKGAEAFTPKADSYTHEIVLQRTLIWSPGDNGSASYRIPSLIRLSNGNLVAAIDHRKTTDYDLPSDIDVEVKISRDNGKTWSKPITVAKGTPEHGYGDAAMATDGKNIYMVMVAGSGLWYYPTHAKKPLEMFFTKSTDGGLTWSPVVEITEQVYTDRYPNGGFFGSGNGIITSKGRIAFVAALRTEPKWGGNMDNVMVYSDDLGKTWQSSVVARKNGDEAKVIELSNGDLLISSRNRAWRPTERTYVISKDHGTTWSEPKTWPDLVGNACNTALTRFSLESEGKGAKNLLIHTLIESTRRDHLRIYLSEDEAKTWSYGNTLCDGEAAYSEVTRLRNGNVGIISEEDDRPAYDIYFTEVSLDWIRKGKPLSKTKPGSR